MPTIHSMYNQTYPFSTSFPDLTITKETLVCPLWEALWEINRSNDGLGLPCLACPRFCQHPGSMKCAIWQASLKEDDALATPRHARLPPTLTEDGKASSVDIFGVPVMKYQQEKQPCDL